MVVILNTEIGFSTSHVGILCFGFVMDATIVAGFCGGPSIFTDTFSDWKG
jgi:hypothetical protein